MGFELNSNSTFDIVYLYINKRELLFNMVSKSKRFKILIHQNSPPGVGFLYYFPPGPCIFATISRPGGGEFTSSEKFPGGMFALGIDCCTDDANYER